MSNKKEKIIDFYNYILSIQSDDKLLKDEIIILNSKQKITNKINEYYILEEFQDFIKKEAMRLNLSIEKYFNSLILSFFDVYNYYKKTLKTNN